MTIFDTKDFEYIKRLRLCMEELREEVPHYDNGSREDELRETYKRVIYAIDDWDKTIKGELATEKQNVIDDLEQAYDLSLTESDTQKTIAKWMAHALLFEEGARHDLIVQYVEAALTEYAAKDESRAADLKAMFDKRRLERCTWTDPDPDEWA